MSERVNKITYVGNPWANGHKVTNSFSLFLQEQQEKDEEDEEDEKDNVKPQDPGIYLSVSIKTEDYNESDKLNQEEDEDENEDLSDWESKSLWNNFHSSHIDCQNAVPIAILNNPIDFSKISNYTFYMDKVEDMEEVELDDFSFFCYILGHDSVAGHQFKFSQKEGKLDLLWIGKVARSYAGDYEFKYDFQVELFGLTYKIRGLETEEASWELFKKVVSNFEDFCYENGYFVLKTSS